MLDLIDMWCFRGMKGLRGLGVKIHRDCMILWSFDVFHFDLRGDSLRMGLCGNAGCLI